MGSIQFMANRPGAGKTCLIGALIDHLARQGKKAAYAKPFSSSPSTDADIAFVSQQLSTPSPPARLIPAASPTSQVDSELAGPLEAPPAVADITLVEGPDLATADGVPPSKGGDTAVDPDAGIVLVLRYERGLDTGAVETWARSVRERLVGVVLNQAPIHRQLEITARWITPLRNNGLPVLGAIPEDRFMMSVTVQQIIDHLGGSWVQEPQNTDAHVDRFLIGGNIMDSGPSYFGRHAHQAVITRAERPDIQMASLMCQTRCLVLTGGGQPTEYIRVEADKKGVPLISVPGDTIGTAEALRGLLERANPYSLAKVRRFYALMQEHLDLAPLNGALG